MSRTTETLADACQPDEIRRIPVRRVSATPDTSGLWHAFAMFGDGGWLGRWTDPAPGRTTTWLMTKTPELLWIGGAVIAVALGIGLVIANPAGISTPENAATGSGTELQGWVIFVAGACFLFGALALLVAGIGLRKRWATHRRRSA